MLKSKKLVFIFLVIIFVMPGVSAYWLYMHPDWLGGTPTNKGRLLTPPVLFSDLHNKPKWALLLWNPGQCQQSERCQHRFWQQLNKLTRIRLALGRRFYDVNLWYVTVDQYDLLIPEIANLLKDQKINHLVLHQNGLHSTLATTSEVQANTEYRTGVYTSVDEDSSTVSTKKFTDAVAFRTKSNEKNEFPMLGSQPQIFIVNPADYLMLSYSLTEDPADIFNDLQRVMNLQRSL